MIRDGIEYFVTSYWGSFILIILGIYLLRDTIKNPMKDKFKALQGDVSGGLSGIGFILLGICIIIAKLVGKL